MPVSRLISFRSVEVELQLSRKSRVVLRLPSSSVQTINILICYKYLNRHIISNRRDLAKRGEGMEVGIENETWERMDYG